MKLSNIALLLGKSRSPVRRCKALICLLVFEQIFIHVSIKCTIFVYVDPQSGNGFLKISMLSFNGRELCHHMALLCYNALIHVLMLILSHVKDNLSD